MSRVIQFIAASLLTGLVVVVGAQAHTFHVDAALCRDAATPAWS